MSVHKLLNTTYLCIPAAELKVNPIYLETWGIICNKLVLIIRSGEFDKICQTNTDIKQIDHEDNVALQLFTYANSVLQKLRAMYWEVPISELAYNNILIDFAKIICDLSKNCLVCFECAPGMQPSICQNDQCKILYNIINPVSLESEILNRAYFVDLQISMLLAAARAKRMDFLDISSLNCTKEEIETIIFNYCPGVGYMKLLVGKNILEESLNKRHAKLYNILKWLIKSNRNVLIPIKGFDQMQTPYQFKLISDFKQEYDFKQSGGLVARGFHGSGMENWLSIMHNGLKNLSNTKYMTSGAAHGQGIYLAQHSSTSSGYSSGGSVTWNKSMFGLTVRCLGLCDVASPINNITVINDEKKVIVRYLFLYTHAKKIPGVNSNTLI